MAGIIQPKNPFTATEKSSANRANGLIAAWTVAAVAAAGAVALFVVWRQGAAESSQQIKAARSQIKEIAGELDQASLQVRTNFEFITVLSNRIADLQKQTAEAGQKARTLEDEMRLALESKDVTISKLQGKLTVTIVDKVMFDSGEAVLKADGASVMQKIATLLAGHPELKIHVVGHTDNVPIRQTAHSRFASNWELSVARALAAVHFLIEKAGVDPRRIGAVGYGEYRPVADNGTAEGRASNRRIEVTILPDEATMPVSGANLAQPDPGPASTNLDDALPIVAEPAGEAALRSEETPN